MDYALRDSNFPLPERQFPFRFFFVRAQRPPTYTTAGKMLRSYKNHLRGLLLGSAFRQKKAMLSRINIAGITLTRFATLPIFIQLELIDRFF